MSALEFIAEIGLNHNGSLDLAKEHIEAAKSAGATTAKFQTFKTEERVPPGHALDEILQTSELAVDAWAELKDFCDRSEIAFLSTAFGLDSLQLLLDIGVKRVKFASFSIGNVGLFQEALKNDLNIVFSTGAAYSAEVKERIGQIGRSPGDHVVLHCISEYPISDISHLNLANIIYLSGLADLRVGFSDHSVGATAATLAVATGATVIEKHFTVDNSLAGPDHSFSANPQVFQEMVRLCEDAHAALGKPREKPYEYELPVTELKSYSDK